MRFTIIGGDEQLKYQSQLHPLKYREYLEDVIFSSSFFLGELPVCCLAKSSGMLFAVFSTLLIP